MRRPSCSFRTAYWLRPEYIITVMCERGNIQELWRSARGSEIPCGTATFYSPLTDKSRQSVSRQHWESPKQGHTKRIKAKICNRKWVFIIFVSFSVPLWCSLPAADICRRPLRRLTLLSRLPPVTVHRRLRLSECWCRLCTNTTHPFTDCNQSHFCLQMLASFARYDSGWFWWYSLSGNADPVVARPPLRKSGV